MADIKACPATFYTRDGHVLTCAMPRHGAPDDRFSRHHALDTRFLGIIHWTGPYGYEDEQIHVHVATLCTPRCDPGAHNGGAPAPGMGPPRTDSRVGEPYRLLRRAIDAEDKAMAEAAAILASGHGVRFVFTIRNGHHVDVKAERLDYDKKGQVV